MGQARRRRLRQKLQPPSRPLWGLRKIVLSLLMLACLPIQSDQLPGTSLAFTEREGLELLNGLLDAVAPDAPQNAFMPPMLKEKLRWVYSTHAQYLPTGHKVVQAIGDYQRDEYGNPNRRTVMAAHFDEQARPVIQIFLSRLAVLVRLQYRIKQGFDKRTEQVFAATLAHEAIHLEGTPSPSPPDRPKAEFLAEEVRTWRKMTLGIIRPLRESGQLVEIDFLQADDVLKQCADPYNCPQFERFVRKQLGME